MLQKYSNHWFVDTQPGADSIFAPPELLDPNVGDPQVRYLAWLWRLYGSEVGAALAEKVHTMTHGARECGAAIVVRGPYAETLGGFLREVGGSSIDIDARG